MQFRRQITVVFVLFGAAIGFAACVTVRPERSSPVREPARAQASISETGDMGLLPKAALQEVKDYALSEEFAADLELVLSKSFYQALTELDAKSDEDVRRLLRSEINRVREEAARGREDLSPRNRELVERYTTELQRLSDSGSPRENLRKQLMRGWGAAKNVALWSAASLAYVMAGTTAAATLPVYVVGKFAVGVIRGERLGAAEVRSEGGVVGDRPYEGYYFVSGSTVTGVILFQSIMAGSGLAPVFLTAQLVNSMAMIIACGSALEGDARAERVCGNLRGIYAFFSRRTDFAAVAGVRVHEFAEKNVPLVLRRKKVVSTRVCKSAERSERVARRVVMRHSERLLELEGVSAVEYGKTPTHPVSRSCGSVLVTVKPDFEIDDVELFVGRVIDGVYVDYKRAATRSP